MPRNAAVPKTDQASKGQVHAPQGIGALAIDMTRAWACA
jgi:hypothetical protein